MSELAHSGRKGQKWGIRRGPPYPLDIPEGSSNGISVLIKQLSKIRYKEFDRLMSAEQVEETKTGSCHDQVMLEFKKLKELGYSPKGLFAMEYSNNQGGMTHSLAHYEKDGKTHWLENAWSERAGDSVYDNVAAIKKEIRKAHASGEFGSKGDYPNLIFGVFDPSEHEVGEDLQTFVDLCLNHRKD